MRGDAGCKASLHWPIRQSLPGLTRQSILFSKEHLAKQMDPRVKLGGDTFGCAMPNHVNRNMLLESLRTKDGRGVGERLRIMFWEA
jgi:hypothetical protein